MMFRRCAVHRLPQLALASLLSLLALAPTAHADGPRLSIMFRHHLADWTPGQPDPGAILPA